MALAPISLFFPPFAMWISSHRKSWRQSSTVWKSYRTRHRDQSAKRNGRSSKANEGQVETDFRQKSQPYAHWKSGRMLWTEQARHGTLEYIPSPVLLLQTTDSKFFSTILATARTNLTRLFHKLRPSGETISIFMTCFNKRKSNVPLHPERKAPLAHSSASRSW